MANKRQLKKQIRYICGDIAGECIMARNFIPGIDAEKMNEVIYGVAALQTSSLKRVTFGYDKVKADFETAHAYNKARNKYFAEAYSKLIADFNAGVNQLVKAMNEALPASQKAASKSALSK